MSKNKGNKSNIAIAKEARNQRGVSWRDSSGNWKYLCLYCLKSMKGQSKCCGFDMYSLGQRPRTPKVNASKHQWKKFFEKFVVGSQSKNKDQLMKIIERRKFYGLSTMVAEMSLKKLENKIENDIVGVFDIKRHEVVEIRIGKSDKNGYNELIQSIKLTAERYGAIEHNALEVTKEYFVVPIFASYRDTYCIPINVAKFNIQKCRARMIPKSHGTDHTMALSVLTNNKKELVDITCSPNSQYGYRQKLYIFTDKLKAMAFRQDFLSIVFPILKTADLPYLSGIVQTVNLDYERVSKKAPQILI